MKKTFAALCAVLSLLLTGLPMAASAAPAEPAEIVIHLDETGQTDIAPRFKYLSLIFTDLEITDGRAVCMANFSTASSRRVQLTVIVERVTVLSKEEIRIRFIGGLEISQPLT